MPNLASLTKCLAAAAAAATTKNSARRTTPATLAIINTSTHILPATTTSAPTPSPASTSRTTAPAHGTPTTTNSSSQKGSAPAFQKAGSSREKPRARLNWRGRVCFERKGQFMLSYGNTKTITTITI